jgi:hypothetical protein
MANNDALTATALFCCYLWDGLSVYTKDELVPILMIIWSKRNK